MPHSPDWPWPCWPGQLQAWSMRQRQASKRLPHHGSAITLFQLKEKARQDMRASHKVPTHMRIPDKVVFGLTARQLLILLIGCSAGYDLWLQLHALNPYTAVGLLVRLFIAVVPVATALVLRLFPAAVHPPV